MAQQIVIDIVAETKKLTEGFNEIDKEVKNVSGKLKGLTSAAAAAASAFVLKKGVSFLKEGIEEAKDAKIAMQQATTTFGEGSKALQKITDDAEKFGKELAVDNDELIVLATQLGSRLPKEVQASSVELVKIFKDVEAFTGGAVAAEAASGKLAKAFADGELKAKELQKIFPGLEQATYEQAEALSAAGKNQDALNLLVEAGSKKYDDAAAKNVTATQKFDTALANFKETLGEKVLPVVERMLGFLTKLLEAFDKQPEWLQNFELGLLALVGIGGPLLSFVPNLQTSLTTLGLLPAASGAAATGLNLVKVALAGLGIGLVIAAIVLLIQNWDDLSAKAKEVAEKVKEFIGDMVEKVKDFLGDAKKWVEDNWPKILAVLTGPFGLFIKWLVDNKDDILQKAKDIYNTVKDWLEENWPKILAVLTGPFGLFALWVVTHKEDLKTKFGELWDAVKDKVNEKVELIIGNVVLWFKSLKDYLAGLFVDSKDTILGVLKEGWELVKSIVGGIIDALGTKIFEAWSKIYNDISDFLVKVVNSTVEKFTEMKDKAVEQFNKLKASASTIWDNIKGYITGVATNIKDKLDEVYGKMVEVGKDIARGIAAGLGQMGNFTRTFLTEWVNNNILKHVKTIMGIKSPSTVMAKIGQQLTEGLYVGMGIPGKPGINLPSINVGGAGAGAPVNITINAGLGTDPYTLGREVSDALERYGRISRYAV